MVLHWEVQVSIYNVYWGVVEKFVIFWTRFSKLEGKTLRGLRVFRQGTSRQLKGPSSQFTSDMLSFIHSVQQTAGYRAHQAGIHGWTGVTI